MSTSRPSRNFFARDTLTVARELLGQRLVRVLDGLTDQSEQSQAFGDAQFVLVTVFRQRDAAHQLQNEHAPPLALPMNPVFH